MISRFFSISCLLSGSLISAAFSSNIVPVSPAATDWSAVPSALTELDLLAVADAVTPAPTSTGIQGIFLTGKREDIISSGRPTMIGIQTMDIDIPGGEKGLKEILQPFLGQDVTQDTVIEIKQKIMLYYVQKGVSTVSVEIPAQKTKGGVVQFLVLRQYFGKPVFKGQTWYNDEQLSRYLGVNPGQDIAEENLQNNLSWLNRNPFQSTTMRYIPGESPDVVDIEVTSQSRRQIRLYERIDNTGSKNTGYGRAASGFTWGNAMWRGDLLSFEYQFSNQFKRLQSYTLNYTCFLPWKHILTLFGSYATIKPSFAPPTIDGTIKAAQFKPRYTIPFKPFYTPFQQSLVFGFDLKNTNSSIVNLTGSSVTVQSTQTSTVKTDINIFQLMGDYNFYDTVGNHSFSLDLALFGSPMQFLPNQTKDSYQKVMRNSQVRYCYFNATVGDVITIPKIMTISLLVRGQAASHTLPGTELFSMGGYDTVRGYDESELATDNGFIGNLELRTMPFSLFRKMKDQLIFLAFLDYGIGNNWFVQQSTTPGAAYIPHTEYLLGVGPGLRYMINPYLQVRCDYGFKLNKLFIPDPTENPFGGGIGQLHFGILGSF